MILISGGDDRPNGNVNAGVDDVNIFNSDDLSLSLDDTGGMNYERWYPTMISLPTGQMVILGGIDGDKEGVAVPEIYTPGEGWRTLEGATDLDLAVSNFYPRAWVNADGEIVYFAGGNGNDGKVNIMALDPSGDGSLREIGELPFSSFWNDPAIMYDAGKVLILGNGGQVWTMDINGPTPVFEQVESLSQVRDLSDLTVMADGKVLLNGGSSTGNTQAGADSTAAIFDPDTGTWDYTVDEDNPRLYHSTTVLLADGTILSLGGGAIGNAEENFLDAQIYRPPYLYNDQGELAERPVVTGAPEEVVPGETFTIQVDDASAIEKITFSKNGAATHSLNMEARLIELDFTTGPNNTIEVTLPENANVVTAGSWMMFVFNADGVPSIAPIIAVNPTLTMYDNIGDLQADYFAIDAPTNSLDEIDFDAAPIHSEQLIEINETGTLGAFFEGGPADYFAVKYTGEFDASQDGDYTFYLTSDDGGRLFIDGQLVIDHDGVFAPTLKTGSISLNAGKYDFEMHYFENFGGAMVDLDWSGPGFTRKQMTFDGGQTESSVPDPDPGTTNTINGTTGNDYLDGTSANDLINLLTGNDVVNGSAGSDVIIGDNSSYDQVDYDGNASDYDFVLNADGTISVTKPDGSIDQLTSIEGFWFKGENVWYPSQELINASGNPVPDQTILGTEGNDYIQGSGGNDTIDGLGGIDVIVGSAGNDIIDGGAGTYNQVDYQGAVADYQFAANADGTITVTKADGAIDTLSNIDGIWFTGEEVWKNIDDVITSGTIPGQTIVGTAGADYLEGTGGDDTIDGLGGIDVLFGSRGNDILRGGDDGYNQINYIGSRSDFVFAQNTDGTITATSELTGTDIISDIVGIYFETEEEWYAVDGLV